ncbi:hypothetical protein LAM69_23765, partial [Mycobacterium tuberculosis]|nr:hypothetical protein [Mycobacterium tuberculosis]
MTTLSRHATIEERAIAALPSLSMPRLPFVRFTRNGALRFLRIGRLQLSWCMCRKPAPAPTYRELMRLPLDQLLRIADFDQH